MTNRHGDHDASCLCCRRLEVDMGWAGTDVTPGDPADFSCMKGHWRAEGYGLPLKIHTMALECPDFEPNKP